MRFVGLFSGCLILLLSVIVSALMLEILRRLTNKIKTRTPSSYNFSGVICALMMLPSWILAFYIESFLGSPFGLVPHWANDLGFLGILSLWPGGTIALLFGLIGPGKDKILATGLLGEIAFIINLSIIGWATFFVCPSHCLTL